MRIIIIIITINITLHHNCDKQCHTRSQECANLGELVKLMVAKLANLLAITFRQALNHLRNPRNVVIARTNK
jgi:hypothetical protein